ncbi:MAG TPA: hypothetical protein VKT70_11305, partial [Stellaceae bacterium]|nr:hypothetical protein [Stellaceae bacterium]
PVRRHALVVKRATTVSLMRTIEELLELPPLGLDDALAAPMAELFTAHPSPFTYRAVIAPILGRTSLPLGLTRALAPACGTEAPRDAVWWQEVLGDQDYRGEDRLETVSFNEGLWRGRKGEGAASPHFAEDLRAGRTALLAAFRRVHGCAPQGFAVK